MKNLMTTIGIGLMITLTSPTFAQDNKDAENKKETHKKLTSEEKAQKRTDKLTTELGLTEKQAKEIYEINLRHIKAMDPIHDEMKKLKDQAKKEHEKTKGDMDKILTEEQKVKAKAFHEKHKGKHKGHDHDHHEE